MYKGKNRRQYPRFRASRLSVKVRQYRDHGDMAQPWDSVLALDYNHTGLGFISVHPFEVGELLEFQFSLENVSVSQVIGEVRNASEQRHGIQFDFSHAHMNSEEVLSALEAIEDKLNTSHRALSGGIRKMKRRDRYSDKY